ncbi:MAG: 1-deoxy-D-xylulose-5-phosphate reductoisomerase [Actinomycetota bacterium]|nr:1-deoxy-D-xylulose-5-phosphate reductoisomerase [Actinomycetota bacterium]
MTIDAPRRLVILGSTGSIGRQALDVVRRHPDALRVVGLVAGSNAEALAAQAGELGVERTGLGAEAAAEMAALDDADIVLNAIVGAAGLRASIAALEAGKVLALANKESLVAAGDACLAAGMRGGGLMVPVDSEHAAIAQCLSGAGTESVDRICLTASGGPFRDRADLSGATKEEALAHPTWSMGSKITIDSATLMNKGLEVIEAHFLFGLDYDRIDVVVHPQSVVHGMVVLKDGSMLMQAARADMRLPIQAALLDAPEVSTRIRPPDLAELGSLEFEPLDHKRFPAVGMAYEAGRIGGTATAVLNAANEEAVFAFLDERIGFVEITKVVESTLEAHEPVPAGNLETVFEVDAWARDYARGVIEKSSGHTTDRVLGRTT